jgi:hypothetical protein
VNEVEYAFFDDDLMWSSIVSEVEPEPETRRWTFHKASFYEIGILPDGSIFDPNGYGAALVREAVTAPPPAAKPPRKREYVKAWPPVELAKLRSLAKTHTLTEAAKEMGRTVRSVTGAAANNRISFEKPLTWTLEKVERLRELAPTHTVKEAAVELGMSFYATQTAARKHKVSFTKKGDVA